MVLTDKMQYRKEYSFVLESLKKKQKNLHAKGENKTKSLKVLIKPKEGRKRGKGGL